MTGGVLIEADELARGLASTNPPLVLDVRWTLGGPPGLADFEAGHLPGAQWLDLDTELAGPPGPGGRHPLPMPDVFQAALRRVGVRASVPVVVCDAATSVAAARLWWMLTDAGHDDVRVLNGGVAAWQAAGLPLATGPAARVIDGTFAIGPGRRRTVSAEDLLARLDDPEATRVIDVRAPERYTGEAETVDPVGGHIPGAVNVPSTLHLGPDGRFVAAADSAARYAEVVQTGSDQGQGAVVYCGSGVTAAHTILALEHAGIFGAALYPGSWSDWIRDPDRPIARGPNA